MVKVLLIEDNQFLRKMTRRMIDQIGEYELVADAESGETGLELVEKLNPDVAIVDIGLPGISGIETVERIRAGAPHVQCLMFTAHDDETKIYAAFEAGAQAYLLKRDATPQKLREALISLNNEKVWLDPLIASQILIEKGLSTQESEVLQRVADSPPGQCSGGVCQVDPDFVARLRRFSPSEKKSCMN